MYIWLIRQFFNLNSLKIISKILMMLSEKEVSGPLSHQAGIDCDLLKTGSCFVLSSESREGRGTGSE